MRGMENGFNNGEKPVRVGDGTPGPGRPKGLPNKTTALLKDAILLAAHRAGREGGMVQYLTEQAEKNPGPFMALLGKVLPMQITGEDGAPIKTELAVGKLSETALREISAIGQ